MGPICEVCNKEVLAGQLYSGIALTAQESLSGHYLCVLDELERRNPMFALRAIQKGLLPNFDPATIVDGKLAKFQTGLPKPQYVLEEEASEASMADDHDA